MAAVLLISSVASTWWSNDGGQWSVTGQAPAGPVWVVTDLTEETFVEIAVPRVFGSDRTQYIQRQLANRFPDSRFRAALVPKASGSLMNRLAPSAQTLLAIEPSDRVEAALANLANPVAGVWSTSMLLVQLAQKIAAQSGVQLVVSNQPSGMRIVFMKNHAPVLTRLVPQVSSASDQAVEILRTVRHLENTRVVERGGTRIATLLRGTAAGLAAILAADRLDVGVAPDSDLTTSAVAWQHALFNLVCKSPAGQLAPVQLRASYLARQLEKGAYIGVGLCIVIAIGAASGSVRTSIEGQVSRNALQATVTELSTKMAEADTALQVYGVSPEYMRLALAADSEEVSTAPDMETDLIQFSRLLSAVDGVRVKSLKWQVLAANEAACTKYEQAVPPVTASGEAPEPKRKVEMQLVASVAADAGPRVLLQTATDISRKIGQLDGAKLLLDPAKRLREGNISAGLAQGDAARGLEWCAELSGYSSRGAGQTAVAQ